jgi:DNA ligase-4
MPRGFHNPRPNLHRRKSIENGEEEDIEPIRSQPDDLVKPPGIEPFGSSPPFGTLCSLYEKFENATRNKHKKPNYKGELLQELSTDQTGLKLWRQNVGPDLFPLIRLLIPEVRCLFSSY